MLEKLVNATNSGEKFDLLEAKSEGMLREVLEKANKLTGVQLSLSGLDEDGYEQMFRDLEREFEGLLPWRFNLESNLSIFADLSDPEIKLKAYEFQDNMNKIFACNSCFVFVNLDEKTTGFSSATRI